MKKLYSLLLAIIIYTGAFSAGDNFMSGSRQASMSNSAVTLSDIWSSYHNQAGLAKLNKMTLGINYNSDFSLSDLANKSLAFATPLSFGTLGINVSHYGFSEYSETKIGLAYAKMLGERISMGIQLDYLNINLPETYGNRGVAVGEIGILAEPIDHLFIGAHVYNINRAKLADYNDERIPTIFRVGMGYEFSDKALITIETEQNIDEKIIGRAGFEYWVVDNVCIRGGGSTNPISRYSLGVGFNMKGFEADFAFSHHAQLGISPHLSLIYSFGKKEEKKDDTEF